MKVKLLIVSFFILISIFNIIMGDIYVPLWVQICIEIISVYIILFCLLNFIGNAKKEIDSQIQSLNVNFSKALEELKSLNIQQKAEFVDALNAKSNDISKLINVADERLSVVLSDECNRIKEQLSSTETTVTKAIETSTNKTLNTLSVSIDNINKTSFESAVSLRHLSKEQHEVLLQRVDGLSQQSEAIQKNISFSFTDLSSKADALGEAITLTSNEIQKHVVSSDVKMSDLVTVSIKTMGESLDASIAKATKMSNEGVESLRLLSKNHHETLLQRVDGVSLQSDAIQKNICSFVTDLSSKSDALGESITLTSNEIKEQMVSSDVKMSDLVTASIKTMGESLDASIAKATKMSNEGVESLRKLSKNHHEALLQRVDGVSLQSDSIQKNICSSVSDLSSKSDALGDTIILTSDKIKEQISSVDKILHSIENQNSTITEQIATKEKDCCVSEAILSSIKDQNEILNKNVTSIQFKAQNIEKSVDLLSNDKSHKKIIESIEYLISELQGTFKSSVSDLSNTLLDTQISQETTNNELEKLQVLLRTVLKSSDKESAKNISEVPKAVKTIAKDPKPASKNTFVSRQGSRPQTQGRQIQESAPKSRNIQPDPNRTENIVDNETGNLVTNQYKDGKVVKSTMKDEKGHMLYELQYVNGRIVRSRNFDKKGQLTIEQTFYDNGQVHYRNEHTPKGKITTEFNSNGKRK